MLSCKNCLYILDINPLLVMSIVSIISHSVGFHFILLMVSFAVQNLLSLIRFHLFIVPFALGDISEKNHCYDLFQRIFCLCFLLVVLWLTVLHLGL